MCSGGLISLIPPGHGCSQTIKNAYKDFTFLNYNAHEECRLLLSAASQSMLNDSAVLELSIQCPWPLYVIKSIMFRWFINANKPTLNTASLCACMPYCVYTKHTIAPVLLQLNKCLNNTVNEQAIRKCNSSSLYVLICLAWNNIDLHAWFYAFITNRCFSDMLQ